MAKLDRKKRKTGKRCRTTTRSKNNKVLRNWRYWFLRHVSVPWLWLSCCT